jgi:hypothetical protein
MKYRSFPQTISKGAAMNEKRSITARPVLIPRQKILDILVLSIYTAL